MKPIIPRPCNCSNDPTEVSIQGYQTYFMRIPISATIYCDNCQVKITRPTKRMAIKAWNRYWDWRTDVKPVTVDPAMIDIIDQAKEDMWAGRFVDYVCHSEGIAKYLVADGYRKESEVAKELLDQVEDIWNECYYGTEFEERLDALRNKYAGGEK